MSDPGGALGNRQVRLLCTALISTTLASGLQFFAVGWLGVQLAVGEGHPERGPLYLGLIAAGRGLPSLVVGLLAGVYADRFDRRAVLMLTRLGGALVSAALAAVVLTGQAGLANVMLLNALGVIADATEMPLRQSITARILPVRDLVRAQGLTNSAFGVTWIFSPLLAGALIGVLGVGGLTLVAAAFNVVAVVPLLGLDRVPSSSTEHPGVLRSLGGGVAFVVRSPVLRWVVLLSALASASVRPLQTMLPAIASDTLSAGTSELALLLAVFGVGGVGGAIFAVWLGSLGRHGLSFIGLVVAWGVVNALFALQGDLAYALLLVALPNLVWAAFASQSLLLIQAYAPDEVRGRALSLYGASVQAVVPFGTLVVGALATLVGLTAALVIGGLAMSAAGVWALLGSTALRRADLAHDPGAKAAGTASGAPGG